MSVVGFSANATRFLELLDDLDALLLSDVHFLMGRWIQDARDVGEFATSDGTGSRLPVSAQPFRALRDLRERVISWDAGFGMFFVPSECTTSWVDWTQDTGHFGEC